MTDFDVNQNMDGTFIMLSTPYGTNLPSMQIISFQITSPLDDYDYSQLSVNTMNDFMISIICLEINNILLKQMTME